MRGLMKVGLSLLILAFVLIGLSYSMLRAQGESGSAGAEGRVVENQARAVTNNVNAVDLDGPIDLTVRQGAVASLSVRGEQRLLAQVVTTLDGDTIHIGTRGMLLLHRRPLQAVLVLPSLASLEVRGSANSDVNGFSGEKMSIVLSGSGSMVFNGRYRALAATQNGSGSLDLNGGNSDKVEAELHGSGSLTAAGTAHELKAQLNGSGNLDAEHLRVESATLELNGSGSATVSASRKLDAEVHGSGNATVLGKPQERKVETRGSGGVSFGE
ncbi:MAG: DUF2807 domain-containing protein [Massilia sp.]